MYTIAVSFQNCTQMHGVFKNIFLIQSSVPEANMAEVELDTTDNNQEVQVCTRIIIIGSIHINDLMQSSMKIGNRNA